MRPTVAFIEHPRVARDQPGFVLWWSVVVDNHTRHATTDTKRTLCGDYVGSVMDGADFDATDGRSCAYCTQRMMTK